MTEEESLTLETQKQLAFDLVTIFLTLLFGVTLFLPWWQADATVLEEYIKMDLNGFGFGDFSWSLEGETLFGEEQGNLRFESAELLIQGLILLSLTISLAIITLSHSLDPLLKSKLKIILSVSMWFIVIFWIGMHGHYKATPDVQGYTKASLNELEDIFNAYGVFSAGLAYGTWLALITASVLLTLAFVEYYLKKTKTMQKGKVVAREVVKKPEEKQTKLYCSQCGAELPPKSAFCSKCGTRVE